MAERSADELLDEFYHSYNEIDRLYSIIAHSAGLSDCAYCLMFDIAKNGGTAALSTICGEWAYTKQTISSAIKSLEGKGLIEVSFVEGSRKNKAVSLTEDGRKLAERFVDPAAMAEFRALEALNAREREQLVALTRRYADALAHELTQVTEGDGESEVSA